MIAGAGRSIGSSASARDGPLAVERAAERIDDAAEQRRPHRHAHHVAGAAHRVAGLDRVDVVEQDAADPVAFEHLGEAELPLVEAQQFVEPDVGQAGDQRDAVADLLDPADLFGLAARARRRRALRGRARARRPAGRQGRSSWVRSARIRVEIGAPAVAHDEMRAAQLQPGDQRGIRREGDLRMGSERLADPRRGSAPDRPARAASR